MSLEHPNVVPIYDAGDVEGRLYLAMRFVDGPDLGSLPPSGGRTRAGPRGGNLRSDRLGARRGTRAWPRAPRRQAVECPARRLRARLPRGLRSDQEPRRTRSPSRARSARSARLPTSRPSSSRVWRSTAARTSTRSAACSTSASPANASSPVTRGSRKPGRTSRKSRPGRAGHGAATGAGRPGRSRGRWRRNRQSAIRPAARWSPPRRAHSGSERPGRTADEPCFSPVPPRSQSPPQPR